MHDRVEVKESIGQLSAVLIGATVSFPARASGVDGAGEALERVVSPVW
jgi:hypothetical protein